jgi:hypothetical protein
MFKFLIILVILVAGAYFAMNQIPSLKERVIEAINPAAKEERLLGELKANLDKLGQSLDEAGKQKSFVDVKSGIKKSQSILGESQDLIEKISEINGDAGLIGSQIGKIINAFSDKTPYPADHLQTTQTSTPAASCAPN